MSFRRSSVLVFWVWVNPTMILDAETGVPLGYSAIQLWTREPKPIVFRF